MRLSPRERRILAAIEDELERNDPALAVTFAETRLPMSFRQRFPLSKAHVCLLFLALLALVLLHSVAVGLGPAGMGVLTGVLICRGSSAPRERTPLWLHVFEGVVDRILDVRVTLMLADRE